MYVLIEVNREDLFNEGRLIIIISTAANISAKMSYHISVTTQSECGKEKCITIDKVITTSPRCCLTKS